MVLDAARHSQIYFGASVANLAQLIPVLMLDSMHGSHLAPTRQVSLGSHLHISTWPGEAPAWRRSVLVHR